MMFTQQEPALAVTTKARKGKAPMELGIEGQEEYSSDEAPNISELDRVTKVARRATRELERENVIFHDRERSNIIHDLEGSEMREWKGPKILLDEFDGVGNAKVKKTIGYDLWANLRSFKADITFGQLLEISPVARCHQKFPTLRFRPSPSGKVIMTRTKSSLGNSMYDSNIPLEYIQLH